LKDSTNGEVLESVAPERAASPLPGTSFSATPPEFALGGMLLLVVLRMTRSFVGLPAYEALPLPRVSERVSISLTFTQPELHTAQQTPTTTTAQQPLAFACIRVNMENYEPLEVIGSGSFGVIRKVRRRSDGKVGHLLGISTGALDWRERVNKGEISTRCTLPV
jgi:hypothetical protein